MNRAKINLQQKTCVLTEKRKLDHAKPKIAVNMSFRKHNNLRFIRTIGRKQLGLKNKV